MTVVIVIGAGLSGIAAAKTYLQVDPTIDLTILESDATLGGTWSQARVFPELLTQQSLGSYELVDLSVKDEGNMHKPGNFIPSQVFHDYIVQYAKEWKIFDKIRYNIKVSRVSRAEDGIRWSVFVEGQDQPMVCDKLIVATGLTSRPKYPNLPTNNFTPLMIHSKFIGKHFEEIISPEIETVSVYGGGKSAYDAAHTACKFGKRVNWIIRKSGHGVGPFIPPMLFGTDLSISGFSPVSARMQPSLFENGLTNKWLHSGTSRIGFALSWWFWRIMSAQALGVWKYDQNENMKKLKPEVYESGMFWCNQPPYFINQPQLLDEIRKGDLVKVYRNDITNLEGTTITLDNGEQLSTDVLILSTGYSTEPTIFSQEDALHLGLPVPISYSQTQTSHHQKWSQLEEEGKEEVLRRFPRLAHPPVKIEPPKYTPYRLYRGVVPLTLLEKNDRSLAFCGCLTGSGQSLVIEATAIWSTAWLTGNVDVKRDIVEVEKEVATLNAFAKRRYINIGNHSPTILFEWFSWIKVMFEELGIELPKKSASEPWLPKDYRGYVERWKAGLNTQEKKDVMSEK